MPKVSVVIPCFNQGRLIGETVDSVLTQSYQDFEIIIVNDGSTDDYTNNKLADYCVNLNISVVTTTNQGLAAARNNGISAAAGEYILPLDADDKIGRTYLEDAVKVLDGNSTVGIVYCDAEFFGQKRSRWKLPQYTARKLLMENIIFCAAMFRKETWTKVGGYNPNMKFGLEDWDFWLSITELGYQVYKIPKILFFYRIKDSSMMTGLENNNEKLFPMYLQAISNHRERFLSDLPALFASLNRFVRKYKISIESVLLLCGYPSWRDSGTPVASFLLSPGSNNSSAQILKASPDRSITDFLTRLLCKVNIFVLDYDLPSDSDQQPQADRFQEIEINGKNIRNEIVSFTVREPHVRICTLVNNATGYGDQQAIAVTIWEIRLNAKQLISSLFFYLRWLCEYYGLRLWPRIEREVRKWRKLLNSRF